MIRPFLVGLFATFLSISVHAQDAVPPIKILFLGDDGHHRPMERFRQIEPILAKRGIALTYSDKLDALDPKILNTYDGLLLYANHAKISPEQEKALLEYVEAGKGFIPLHCASYCFLNSPKFIELVGAQFQKHGTGEFRPTVTTIDHPILKGYKGFSSWDETYVHTKHNDKDRVILEYRDKEPWTWTRTQGKGRIFYTAWGHDQRTWGHAGFQNLLERGIRWAIGGDPSVVPAFADETAPLPKNVGLKPFEYIEAKIPFYPGGQRGGKTADAVSKMQKPLDAEESLKHMVVPAGFEVKLFTADPAIKRPICMNWDHRGRLWIAETVDYPNEIKTSGEGRDRIVICEDTDGDGKADKFTVFADKLSIPTSFTFYKKGIIVTQAPDMLFLEDTDGDDKADVRKVLFTGWHTNDTHAGPSNLHWGFDNWVYGMVGYAGFDGIVGGERHSFRTGFFRFQPDGSKLEFLRNTNNNSWGVGFSEEGVLFGSTANGNASVHLPIPNRYYEKVRGWSSSVLGTIADSQRIEPITEKVRQVDHHGNFTAAAGHALYTARDYPADYQNKIAFVTEPTGHLVAKFRLEPKGATFVARNLGSFLSSDDEWTAPIMAEVGPDGQLWVIDWYNYIVQHNPTPPGFKNGKGNAYETPIRDKTHGRIVRVVAKSEKSAPVPQLNKATPEQLVAALKHNNLFWRKQAQRLLVERDQTDVIPALISLTIDTGTDELGLNPGAIHALWTLHGLGALQGKNDEATQAALTGLSHKSPSVRRNALMVLPRIESSVAHIVNAKVLNDSDPQVRLASLLTLSEMPTPAIDSASLGDSLVGLFRSESLKGDSWLLDAATAAAASHDRAFLASLGRQAWQATDLGYPWKIQVERIAEHHARGGAGEALPEILKSMASLPKDLSGAILTGLARGWPAGKTLKLTEETEKSLEALLPKVGPAERGQLALLAKRWGVQTLDKHLASIAAGYLAQLRNGKEPEQSRADAAVGFMDLRRADPTAPKELLGILSPQLSPVVVRGILEALTHSDAPTVGKELMAVTPYLTPALRPTAVRVLLAKADWTGALLDGFDSGSIPLSDLSLDQKQALIAHPNKSVAARAKTIISRGGGLPSPDRQKVVDELMFVAKQTGDPAAGKLLFKQHCAKCHMHGNEGAKIGPDLTGMAVHPKSHLLIEIMDPNRSVEGNFRQYVVTTKSGRVMTGLLASESKTAITIIDSEAKSYPLQREDIDELQATTKSLMPEGFEKQIPAKDLANLLEFLTQRGKYLPLPLAKAATAISTKGMFTDVKNGAERLIFPDWNPKTFEGVPFQFVDPQGDKTPNVILLAGPKTSIAADMPKTVSVPYSGPAKAIHMLSGISGWGSPGGQKGSVSMIVRLHYTDGKTEDHPLRNGEHFADYIRRVDVPGSKYAFGMRSQQIRYLAVHPKRDEAITRIDFVKGSDNTAPVILAVTVESSTKAP